MLYGGCGYKVSGMDTQGISLSSRNLTISSRTQPWSFTLKQNIIKNIIDLHYISRSENIDLIFHILVQLSLNFCFCLT